jgi:hypothetical protein
METVWWLDEYGFFNRFAQTQHNSNEALKLWQRSISENQGMPTKGERRWNLVG